MITNITKNSQRKKTGSIAEFGPALFVLLVLIFFPMIDLIQMGVAYMSCNFMNEQQLNHLSTNLQVVTNTSSSGFPAFSAYSIGIAVNDLNTFRTFLNHSAFARLANIVPLGSISATNIIGPVYRPTENTYYVQFSTVITSNPFLFIPFFHGMPGIGAPVTYTIAGERPVETVVQN